MSEKSDNDKAIAGVIAFLFFCMYMCVTVIYLFGLGQLPKWFIATSLILLTLRYLGSTIRNLA